MNDTSVDPVCVLEDLDALDEDEDTLVEVPRLKRPQRCTCDVDHTTGHRYCRLCGAPLG